MSVHLVGPDLERVEYVIFISLSIILPTKHVYFVTWITTDAEQFQNYTLC